MNKAMVAAFAVVIVLLSSILTVVTLDYYQSLSPAATPTATPSPTETLVPNSPTATPSPSATTPTPIPTPVNIHDMPGELIITSAAYRVWTSYPQLYVWFNWTGPSFNLPKIRFSVEEHFEVLSGSNTAINHSENTLVWTEFPLGDYAPHGQFELRFLDVNDNTIRTAYYPIANLTTYLTPSPEPTPPPKPLSTPDPIDPSGEITITSVTTYTPTGASPITVAFNWTGEPFYIRQIMVAVNTETYWRIPKETIKINNGENGISVYPHDPSLSFPTGMWLELAFINYSAANPFRTATFSNIAGELTITKAAFLEWSGSDQLFVRFNWTGPSFLPPRIRLSIEDHVHWWTAGNYVINQTGNKSPLIAYIGPGNYAPGAQVELAFYDALSDTPFSTAYFPVENVTILHVGDDF